MDRFFIESGPGLNIFRNIFNNSLQDFRGTICGAIEVDLKASKTFKAFKHLIIKSYKRGCPNRTDF